MGTLWKRIFVGQIKYKVIYADPPWHYNDKRENGQGGMGGGAVSHYPLMKTPEICKLPIKDLADEDCLLFIWVTFPTLVDALKVIEAWGFTYKTLGFAWIKTNKRQNLNQGMLLPTDYIDDFFGVGFYTKSNCEVCLIATKGKPSRLIKSNNVSSTIISPRREHSRKPQEARNRIVQLCGDVPRVELFAREKFEGWDTWGNEIKNDIDI